MTSKARTMVSISNLLSGMVQPYHEEFMNVRAAVNWLTGLDRARVWKMRPPRRRRWAGCGRVWTLRMAFIWRRRKAVRPSSALTRISPMPPTPSAASRCERPDRPVLQ